MMLPSMRIALKYSLLSLACSIYFMFVLESGQVKGLKERDPSGEHTFPRQ
jgi:hypothetical protein